MTLIEKWAQFKWQLEIFISPQTPQFRAGNNEVRKILHAVTFIPKTGNKMYLGSSMYTIPLLFLKTASLWKPIKERNWNPDSHKKRSRAQHTGRNTVVHWLVVAVAGSDVRGRARMKRQKGGMAATRHHHRSGLPSPAVLLWTGAFYIINNRTRISVH